MQTTLIHSTPQDNQQCCYCLDYRGGVLLTGSLFLAMCLIFITLAAVIVATTVGLGQITAIAYYVDFGIYGLWILGSIFLIIGGAQRSSVCVLVGFIISIICVILYGIGLAFVAYSVFSLLGYVVPVFSLVVVIVKIVVFFLMCYGLYGISRYRTQLAMGSPASRQTVVSNPSTYASNPGTASVNCEQQQPEYGYNQPNTDF